MKRRLLLHFLTLIGGYLITTKLMGLIVNLQMLPMRANVTWAIFLAAFLFPFLYGIIRFVESKKLPEPVKMIGIAVLGAVVAWVFMILELHIYRFGKDFSQSIGWFADEFYVAIARVFPMLLIGEILNKLTKNWKNWHIGALTGIAFLAMIFGMKNLMSMPEITQDFPEVQNASPDKPNVVLILADDLGYGDISLHGNTMISTPHIDSIAKAGVDFTRGYASAPICAPSRAGMLTGRHQVRFGYEFLPDPFLSHPRVRKQDYEDAGNQLNKKAWWNAVSLKEKGLPESEFTLAEMLKQEGYATGIVGKWHYGMHPRFRANRHGFDYHFGFYGAAELFARANAPDIEVSRHKWSFMDALYWDVLECWVYENGEEVSDQYNEYVTDLYTKKSVEFIENNKDNRFFLHISHPAPHAPFQAPKVYYDQLSHIEDHNKRVYYAMIKCMDDGIGEVMEKLRELNLEENTIVIFASDNGGATYTRAAKNAPFFGGKMSNFQGGLVVPYMMQWKGKIDSGMNFENPASLLDIMPTIAAGANINLPKDITYDGVNLIPYLTDSTFQNQKPHETLFWRNGYVKTILDGDFKLHLNEKHGVTFLNNVKTDVYESNNLAEKMPEKVAELTAKWEAWNQELRSPIWESACDVSIPTLEDGTGERYFYPW